MTRPALLYFILPLLNPDIPASKADESNYRKPPSHGDSMPTREMPLVSSVHTLTIDLRNIDPSEFSWMYHHVSDVPVIAGGGHVLPSGDFNNNDQAEVYGIHHSQTEGGTRIYELQPDYTWEFRFEYPFAVGVVEAIDDIDRNGLVEALTSFGDTLFAFEQPDMYSLPFVNKFRFRQWHINSFDIPVELWDMDSDGFKELVYRGSEQDSGYADLPKTYVAGYDSVVNNLSIAWGEQLPPGCDDIYCTLHITTGDFDEDGRQEFVTSAFMGNVYCVEHVKGDSFSVSWADSISTAGRIGSGDVDGNGLTEFFVGGIQLEPDGYWHFTITVYETTGDNSYQEVSVIDLFPVELFAVESLYTVDIDGDSQEELLCAFGGGNVVIKGGGHSSSYELFYYDDVVGSDGFSAADVTSDQIPELFVSRWYLDSLGIFTHTEIYELDSSLVTDFTNSQENRPQQFILHQNYPNPFNPSTTIRFELPRPGEVSLKIFNLLGEEVAILVSGPKDAGNHTVQWDATGQPSGVYFYRLRAGEFVETKKLVLIK